MTRGRPAAWERWVVGCFGIIGSVAILTSMRQIGGTFDEFFYLDAGLERWRTGSNARLLAAGTMPLPIDVATLLPYLVERHRGQAWSLHDEYRDVLQIARLPTLLFWWVVLLTGWSIARRLGGRTAGVGAAAFLAGEPNLLAHSALATTDVAFTAFVLLFAFTADWGVGRAWWARVGLPGVVCGFAFCAKASAMVFVPILLIAIGMLPTAATNSLSSQPLALREFASRLRCRGFWKDATTIYLIGLGLAYFYCGSDWKAHPKFIAAASGLPPGRVRDLALWIAENLRVFQNAGVALWYQISHNLRGHGSYLLGEEVPRAVWYHFPIALSMKLTPAVLLTIAIAAIVSWRSLFHWPFIASFLMLLSSLNCRVQIGVRLQLPLIACTCVAAAITWSRAFDALRDESARQQASLGSVGRRILAGWLVISVAWMVLALYQNWPHYLTYVNDFWGGPAQGEKLVSDSNFDWGQGIPDLLQMIESNDMPTPVALWYFGTDPAAQKPPLRLVPLHKADIRTASELRRYVNEKYLAVGTTILYGSYIHEPRWLIEWLRQKPYVARTRTFLIFDLDD
jgi:hypothetical protein